MLQTNITGTKIVPPIVNFGVKEKANTNFVCSEEKYDYTSQTNSVPMFCGSDKYCTWSAKNYGGLIFKDWRNVTDDAEEK